MGIHYVVGIVQSRLLLIFEDRIVKIVRSKAAAGKLVDLLDDTAFALHKSKFYSGVKGAVRIVQLRPFNLSVFSPPVAVFIFSI